MEGEIKLRVVFSDIEGRVTGGIDAYPMGKPQPAQIDCRKTDCLYHKNAACHNPAPAITLNENDKFVCWSYKKEEK